LAITTNDGVLGGRLVSFRDCVGPASGAKKLTSPACFRFGGSFFGGSGGCAMCGGRAGAWANSCAAQSVTSSVKIIVLVLVVVLGTDRCRLMLRPKQSKNEDDEEDEDDRNFFTSADA
jgi:hypothetical protein